MRRFMAYVPARTSEMPVARMDDEAERLFGLLDACHRVLRHLSDDEQTHLANALRETCRLVEARLRELGVPYAEAS
jgi:hypothetical protein